jgi:hypothetical protein
MPPTIDALTKCAGERAVRGDLRFKDIASHFLGRTESLTPYRGSMLKPIPFRVVPKTIPLRVMPQRRPLRVISQRSPLRIVGGREKLEARGQVS